MSAALQEASQEALIALWQYVSDLKFPPTGDSLDRRIQRAEQVAAKLSDALRDQSEVRQNPHTGQTYTVAQSDVPFALDDGECPDCDGNGRIWNNADPTSGQWVDCDCAKVSA